MARPRVYSPDLRDRLIDATAFTIAARGPDALSMRNLAADVGTSTNAVYTLFGSRDDLIQAVVEEALASFNQAQIDAVGEGRSVDDLLSLGWAYYNWARANPAMYGVMYSPNSAKCDPTERGPHNSPESLKPLMKVVSNLVADGTFRPERPEYIAISIHANVHGLASFDVVLGGRPTDHECVVSHLKANIRAWLTDPSLLD